MIPWRIDFRKEFDKWVERDDPDEEKQDRLYDWFFERVDSGPAEDAPLVTGTDEYAFDIPTLGVRVTYFVVGHPEYLLLVSGIIRLDGT